MLRLWGTTLVLLVTAFSVGWAQCGTSGRVASNVQLVDKASISYDDEVQEIVDQLNAFYGFSREYYYYDDRGSPNAYAEPQDGNIYLGVSFLNSFYRGATSVSGIRCIIAHEFGHLYQFDNTDASLLGDKRGNKYGELQADFLAGYALVELSYINENSYRQVLGQAWAVGDATGAWRNPRAHGTSTERINDTYLGMEHHTESLDDAYTWAHDHLPPLSTETKLVGIIRLQNGARLNILYGGVIVDTQGAQIAQMSGIPNSPLFRINFTREGTSDLILDPSTGLVYIFNQYNQPIGTYNMMSLR